MNSSLFSSHFTSPSSAFFNCYALTLALAPKNERLEDFIEWSVCVLYVMHVHRHHVCEWTGKTSFFFSHFIFCVCLLLHIDRTMGFLSVLNVLLCLHDHHQFNACAHKITHQPTDKCREREREIHTHNKCSL